MAFLDWLRKGLRKQRAERYPALGIVAHYWDGGVPKEHPVKDISLTGAYLYATELWYIGTIIDVALRKLPGPGETASAVSVLCLRCKIVRHDPDGIGITFMLRSSEERKALKDFMSNTVASAGPHLAPAKCHAAEQGQALIEYAFMVPFLLLLIVNCVNFGAFLYDWIEVANAVRAGAQYAILGPVSPSGTTGGGLTPATGAQIKAVITSDLKTLPGTPTINICENNNGTLTTLTGTCSTTTTPSDPEAPLYVLATVDVTYPYTPLTGELSFPKLGIYATIPPTSIHRQAVMRVLQ